LAAAGLYVKNDQENSRHQNKKKAGNETEIVGFHGNPEFDQTVSPPPGLALPSFIARSGIALLKLKVGLGLGLRPGQGARGQGRFQGAGQHPIPIRQTDLRTGEYHQRALNKGLAGQSPGRRATAKLLFFDRGAWGQSEGIGPIDLHETRDALAAAPAIAQFSLEAVDLNPFPQGHFPQVFTGITLDVPAFTNETNHRHDLAPNPHFAGSCRCGPRFGP